MSCKGRERQRRGESEGGEEEIGRKDRCLKNEKKRAVEWFVGALAAPPHLTASPQALLM